jgi:hypothetical protein
MPKKGMILVLSTPAYSKPLPGDFVFEKSKISSSHSLAGTTDN